MKKSEKSAKSQVKLLLRQAEEFAAASVGGVLCGLEEDPKRPNHLYREYAQLMRGLEIHFLFPNLNRGEQKVLEGLLEARNKLVVRRRGAVRGSGLQRRMPKPAEGPDIWQSKFRRLSTRAKALGHSAELTPAQRGVIDHMLLPNPQ
jgi:hypothetical protein